MHALIRRHEAAMRLIQSELFDEHFRWLILHAVIHGQLP